ncbi:retrovirus-related pol polyprotein from transposon TNT 1-94 [Tanacetum coccineum]
MEILIKTCLMPLALKTQNDSFAFVHELKKEIHADLKYVESLENEIDELESDKSEFSNMYDMLLQECVSNDECECLAQKLSKQTEFDSKEVYTELFAKLEKYWISLELTLQQCKKQMKNDTICKEKASNVFQKEREQYFEIQDLKAQLLDKNIAISELKKLIEKCKGKSVETKFDKPSVVRQPNVQRIPKPSVLGKPTPFSDSLERKNFAKKKSVPKTNESEGLSKPVTSQNLPQTASQAVRNTNVIKPGMYQINRSTTQTRAPQLPQTYRNTNPRVSTSTGVAHKTNVSIPHPRSTQKTSNVNVDCATCGKCMFNSNHDSCVSKYLNDVNARTKKPNIVPISTRKPKSQANKSVATYRKKTVASKSTITNSKSYYRMLYAKTNLQGNDLLTGNPGSDLYTISLHETTSSTPICLMAKALPTQAWLWHQRLSHLNFNNINLLSKKDVVIGLPKLKYVKDQLYTTVPSKQELDLLFGPLYDEFFNTGTSCVNKSSSPTDNSAPQDTQPSSNIQPTSEPTTPTNAHAEENNDNQADDTEHEFTNPFCTPVQEVAESSSRSIGTSNMHTFNQP